MPSNAGAAANTVDRAEIDRFTAQAERWWDPDGPFRPLHRMNPVRLQFIRSQFLAHFDRDPRALRPFAGLRLIDIGCGGGLAAEPMARLGFAVTGVDADAEGIAVARAHAEMTGLPIDYRVAAAEEIADGGERFDAVLALELVEHVADLDTLFAAIGDLLLPRGAFAGATINRTARSFARAIIVGEYVLGWLPRGTHDWRRFMRPSEFVSGLRRNGIAATRLAGIGYDLRSGGWQLSEDVSVNYMLMGVRR